MQHKIVYQRPSLTKRHEPVYNFKIVNKPIIPASVPHQPVLVPKPRLSAQAIPRKQAIIRYAKAGELNHEGQQKVLALRGVGRGKVLVILGNGPSLTEVDTTQLNGLSRVHTLSVNHPDLRVWPTTYWAFCDMSQYNRHQEHWKNYE